MMRRSQRRIGFSLANLLCGLTLCMLQHVQALEEGDACTLKDNLAGECKPTSSCESTLQKYIKAGRLKNNDVPSCTLGTREEIICCPVVECCSDQTSLSQVTSANPIATSASIMEPESIELANMRKNVTLDANLPYFDLNQMLQEKPDTPTVPPKDQFEINSNLPLVTHEAIIEPPRSWNSAPLQSLGPQGKVPGNDRQERIINRPSALKPPRRFTTPFPARGNRESVNLIEQVNEKLRNQGMHIEKANQVSSFEVPMGSRWKTTTTTTTTTKTTTTTTRPLGEYDLDPFAPFRFRENQKQDVEQSGSTTTSTTTTEKSIEVTPTTRVDVGNKDRPAVRACRNIEERSEINALTPHILDGVQVEPGVYPHMAAIAFRVFGNIQYGCGGSLITRRHVMTAAHCVNDPNRDPIFVRLGTVNIENVGKYYQDINVTTNIAIHPNYVSSSKYNDIAILELVEEARLSFYIYPACLETELADPPAAAKIFVAGWGTIDKITKATSQVLLRAPLSIVSLPVCNRTVQEEQPLYTRQLKNGVIESMVCAQDTKNLKADSCQGDSGGPLMYERDIHDNKYSILGVVSAGFGCATKTPGLYTRVASYLDFIESVVWPNNVV